MDGRSGPWFGVLSVFPQAELFEPRIGGQSGCSAGPPLSLCLSTGASARPRGAQTCAATFVVALCGALLVRV